MSARCHAGLWTMLCLAAPLWADAVKVDHNATKAIAGGDEIVVVAQGPANQTATFSFGAAVQNVPMTQVRPGVYTGSYTVKRTDKLEGQPVTVTLRGPGNAVHTGTADHALGSPARPDVNADEPEIRELSPVPKEWLRAGAKVVFALAGTAGGTATIHAPGVMDSLVLTEVQPGRYAGQWVVPAGVRLSAAVPVVAHLLVGDLSAVVEADGPLQVDTVPPAVQVVRPLEADGAGSERPRLVALLGDEGSGIDQGRTKLLYDGRPLKLHETTDQALLTWRPGDELSPGVHRFHVSVGDHAGNVTDVEWSFGVAKAAPKIRSLTHDSVVKPRPGDVINVRLEGDPGGRAVFYIGVDRRDLPMTEKEPGIYLGSYTVRQGEDLGGMKVTALLVGADGGRSTFVAPTLVSGAAPVQDLRAPVVTTPKQGDKVGADVVINGTAKPGSRVRLRTAVRGSIGGILDLRDDLPETVVAVNARGEWTTQSLRFDKLALAKTTTFTITAVCLDGDRESAPTVVQVSR